MELRCQLRFARAEEGIRAILEARDVDRSVLVMIEATGADEGEALSALAGRTRAFYGAVVGMVETVEEVLSRYYEPEGADGDEDAADPSAFA